jgi:outer membrane protein
MALGIVTKMRAGAVALAVLAVAPVQATAETLADALASAYEHSGLLMQNRALLRAADEDVAVSLSSLRPIIGWSARVERSFSKFENAASTPSVLHNSATEANIGLSASLLVYDGGASKLAVEAAKETVLSTRQQLISIEQQVLLGAVQAYMNVVRDAQIVELRRNNLRLVARELQAAKDRFDVGEVTRTDVALAEAQLAGGRANLAIAEGNLMASKEQYAAAVGRQPGTLSAPRGLPQVPARVEEARAIAERSHPDLSAVQHAIQAAEYGVERARAAMGPTVRLQGSYGITRDLSDDRYFSQGGAVSLGLEQPIYRGGQLSALLRQAMANRDAQRGRLHATRNSIRQQAGSAWAGFASAKAQLRASAQQIEAARIAFDGVREEAKLGSRTTLDVLIAEQDLLDAESSRITARASEVTAAYSVLSAMGLLTAENLNLKVERYDPEAYYNLVKTAPINRSKRGQQLDKVLKAIGKE